MKDLRFAAVEYLQAALELLGHEHHRNGQDNVSDKPRRVEDADPAYADWKPREDLSHDLLDRRRIHAVRRMREARDNIRGGARGLGRGGMHARVLRAP
jgi:hypothetical protein